MNKSAARSNPVSRSPLRDLGRMIRDEDEISDARRRKHTKYHSLSTRLRYFLIRSGIAFLLILPIIAFGAVYLQPTFDVIGGVISAITASVAVGALITAIVELTQNNSRRIGERKQHMRDRTVEHLRETISRFRELESKLIHDWLSISLHDDRESDRNARSSISAIAMDQLELWSFRLAVREWASKNPGAPITDFPRATSKTPTGRPRPHDKFLDIVFACYPLFSYCWSMFMYHEMLAAGVARKVFGFRTVDAISGPQLVHTYDVWEQFIKRVRVLPGAHHSFRHYQWLVSCIVQVRASRAISDLEQSLSSQDVKSHLWWLRQSTQSRFYPRFDKITYRNREDSVLSFLYDIYGTETDLETQIKLQKIEVDEAISKYEAKLASLSLFEVKPAPAPADEMVIDSQQSGIPQS
ncbi:MAG: hypothetical protein HEQ23_01340 [Tepidisphaera sp.]